MIGIVALVIFLIYWLFFRKKDTKKESGYLQYGDIDAETGYGPEYGAFQSYGYESSMKKDCGAGETKTIVYDWLEYTNDAGQTFKTKCCPRTECRKKTSSAYLGESSYAKGKCKLNGKPIECDKLTADQKEALKDAPPSK